MTDRQAEGKRKLILAIALLEKERIDKENHKRKRKTAIYQKMIQLLFNFFIGKKK